MNLTDFSGLGAILSNPLMFFTFAAVVFCVALTTYAVAQFLWFVGGIIWSMWRWRPGEFDDEGWS